MKENEKAKRIWRKGLVKYKAHSLRTIPSCRKKELDTVDFDDYPWENSEAFFESGVPLDFTVSVNKHIMKHRGLSRDYSLKALRHKNPLIGKRLFKQRAAAYKILKLSAQEASLRAQKEAKALGIPIQVIRNGELIIEYPNGEVKKIKSIRKVKSKIEVTKGTVLCLKQND